MEKILTVNIADLQKSYIDYEELAPKLTKLNQALEKGFKVQHTQATLLPSNEGRMIFSTLIFILWKSE